MCNLCLIFNILLVEVMEFIKKLGENMDIFVTIIELGKASELTLGYIAKLSENIYRPNTWHWGEIKLNK